ncbi:hypothetical protein [Oceanirhabdus seepicola]|nr:hypothetical protein [Oceanirhabdus seepicola]
MGNQQGSPEKGNLQRLERNLVPASVGKWGASIMDGDIVCAYVKA